MMQFLMYDALTANNIIVLWCWMDHLVNGRVFSKTDKSFEAENTKRMKVFSFPMMWLIETKLKVICVSPNNELLQTILDL